MCFIRSCTFIFSRIATKSTINYLAAFINAEREFPVLESRSVSGLVEQPGMALCPCPFQLIATRFCPIVARIFCDHLHPQVVGLMPHNYLPLTNHPLYLASPPGVQRRLRQSPSEFFIILFSITGATRCLISFCTE